MAYRLRLRESVHAGFLRIGLEQIDKARQMLAATGDPAAAIHETRKCLKRIRALLRLFKPGLGRAAFKAENARFRDMAKLLAGARDQHVMLETLTNLALPASKSARASLSAMRETLAVPLNGGDQQGILAGLDAARTRLASCRDTFAGLTIEPDTFTVVGDGLETSYGRARKLFEEAFERPSGAAFHQWRKGVQLHWRHMALLSRAWPELMDARIGEARQLSQILGDDHDLSVLSEAVNRGLPAARARVIAGACQARQDELRVLARPRGARLFAESSRRHRRRMERYWHLAAEMDRDERSPPAEPAARDAGQPARV